MATCKTSSRWRSRLDGQLISGKAALNDSIFYKTLMLDREEQKRQMKKMFTAAEMEAALKTFEKEKGL